MGESALTDGGGSILTRRREEGNILTNGEGSILTHEEKGVPLHTGGSGINLQWSVSAVDGHGQSGSGPYLAGLRSTPAT